MFVAQPVAQRVSKDYQEVVVRWWKRGRPGVRWRCSRADWSAGFVLDAADRTATANDRSTGGRGERQAGVRTTCAHWTFMLVGPTGHGHTSLIYMIKSQVAYTIDALHYLRRTGAAALEVRPQAQVAYNEVIQRRMDGTVWTAGSCTSWYLDAHGHNTTLWPRFTWRFRRATRRFQPAEYIAYERVAQPVAA